MSEHDAELADMLLQQIEGLSAQIERVDAHAEQLLEDIPAAQAPPGRDGADGKPAHLSAVDRIDEISGIGRHAPKRSSPRSGYRRPFFPPPCTWPRGPSSRYCAVQSGATTRASKTGKGSPCLKSALGEAAAAAGRTNTFLGIRYRRLARRIGKIKAPVAVARSILVIIWHLLTDPTARYHDLVAEFFDNRVRPERRKQKPHSPTRSPRPAT